MCVVALTGHAVSVPGKKSIHPTTQTNSSLSIIVLLPSASINHIICAFVILHPSCRTLRYCGWTLRDKACVHFHATRRRNHIFAFTHCQMKSGTTAAKFVRDCVFWRLKVSSSLSSSILCHPASMYHHRHYLASHQSFIFQISLKKWPPGTTAPKTSGVVSIASLLLDASRYHSSKDVWRRERCIAPYWCCFCDRWYEINIHRKRSGEGRATKTDVIKT